MPINSVMEAKLKVLLLGNDANLLEKTCERLNSSHPLDVSFYIDLKHFLEQCIEIQPDIVGISFNYHHKSITQFPRIIEMAVNVPVIVFGEGRNNKVLQDIIVAKTPYKITGGMTAQNMWVQISKFIKFKEDKKEKERRELLETENNFIKNNQIGESLENNFGGTNKNNSVFLKGETNEKSEQEKNKLLNSLFNSLNSDLDSEKNELSNIIKSSDATEFKKNQVNHINTSDTRDLQGYFNDPESVEQNTKKGNKEINNELFDSVDENNSRTNHDNNKRNRNDMPSYLDTEDRQSNNLQALKSATVINFNERKSAQQTKDHGIGNLETSDRGRDKNNFHEALDSASNNKKGTESLPNEKNTQSNGKNESPSPQRTGARNDVNNNNSALDRSYNKKESVIFDEAPVLKNKNSENLINKKSENNTEEDASGPEEKRAKKKESGKFGAIKLADEKEVRENKKKKAKQKKEAEQTNKKNLLIESCEVGLRKCFTSTTVAEPWPFESESINVYIVEQSNFKGFLLIANSFKHDLEPHISEEFRATIIENFKKNGAGIEISHPFSISAKSMNYPELVKTFCDFVIIHEEGNGKEHVVSFLPREVVRPKVEPSEKEDMYSIDIKTIPPQTKVNFDAFLYLPKNQKFVRYLKDGRSLSLEQAKRQSEILQNSNLYLPKEQKQKFFEFFVQNTIDWEIAISKKKIAI